MYGTFADLVQRLAQLDEAQKVMTSCAPVPFFGDPSAASVATVGINPSNREFLDIQGRELAGAERRFHTQASLGLHSWQQMSGSDLRRITQTCLRYFRARPYDGWFRVLEKVLQGAGHTYYGRHPSACHLDLVPFATSVKWGTLPASARGNLIESSARSFAEVVRESPVSLLILNGMTVVRCFEAQSGIVLANTREPAWDLARASGTPVPGFGYVGETTVLSGIELGRTVKVVGYNHNLQSSFGVTSNAKSAIARWLNEVVAQ